MYFIRENNIKKGKEIKRGEQINMETEDERIQSTIYAIQHLLARQHEGQ